MRFTTSVVLKSQGVSRKSSQKYWRPEKEGGERRGWLRTRHILSLSQPPTEFWPSNMQAWPPCCIHLCWKNWFHPDSVTLFLATSFQRRNKFQRELPVNYQIRFKWNQWADWHWCHQADFMAFNDSYHCFAKIFSFHLRKTTI